MINIFEPFPRLESKRLVLKALENKDRTGIFDYQSNKTNFPFVKMAVYQDIKEVDDYLNKMNKGVSENKWIIWGIHKKDDDLLIGTISIWNLNHETEIAELGYGIFPGYRQSAYMSEAINLCLEYGFNQMGLKILEAYTNTANIPSRKLLEKLSFEYIKDLDEDGDCLAVYKKENKLSQ